MNREMLERLLAAREELRSVALVTDLDSDRQFLFPDDESHLQSVGDGYVECVAGIHQALRRDRSGSIEVNGSKLFVHVHNAPLKMLIIGAVHIAQALVPLAVIAGYRVVVIDPRRAFASDDRFPGVVVSTEWPDKALINQKIDDRTAVVTLTHDPKLDDPALEVALKSDSFYIGSLGSHRTHAARLERLQKSGFGEDSLTRIHAPVGLDIGASSPAEIAISIMAEVTSRLRVEAI